MHRPGLLKLGQHELRTILKMLTLTVVSTNCGGRSDLSLIDEVGWLAAGSAGAAANGATAPSGGAASGGAATPGASTGGAPSAPAPRDPRICVFDYDLTLSSHDCVETMAQPGYFCRENSCDTYGWYSQCLGIDARAAIAECVRRGAYIGIASKADVDNCWTDKVLPILDEAQFPEWTSFIDAARGSTDHERIELRTNWNCDNCAYTMDGGLGKPDGIRRVMRHFGFDPELPTDRARVIFWDDTLSNINDVRSQLPEVRAVLVPSFTGAGVDGGCGITQNDIDAGWAP